MDNQKKTARTLGWLFIVLWAALIVTGIYAKRGLDQPDLVVFFHLPAAVFLVVGWYLLAARNRQIYKNIVASNYNETAEDGQ